MNNEVLILFTMDVELVSSGPTTSGPANNEQGARRVREYMEVIGDYGYKPKLKTIVIDVHNDRSFKDLSTTPAKQLKTVLDNLKPELEKYGMTPVSATYDQAITRFIKGTI